MGKKTSTPAKTIDPADLDAMQRAALAMVSRPRSEVTPKCDLTAGHWAGMPEYHEGCPPPKLIITFENKDDRLAFAEQAGIRLKPCLRETMSARWPDRENRDIASLRFAEGA